MRKPLFTAAELEELRIIDSLIDAAPMTHADYERSAFVDALLFPESAKRKEAASAAYNRQKAAQIERGTFEREQEKQRAYYEARREQIKARKAEWYRRNRERITATQRAYYQRQQAARITA